MTLQLLQGLLQDTSRRLVWQTSSVRVSTNHGWHNRISSEMILNSLLSPAKRIVPKPVKKRLKRILGLDKALIHFPTFDKDALIRSVQRYAGSRTELTASNRADTGNHIASIDDVVEYFRKRERPAFFVDGPTLRRLADDISAQRPEWRERLLALVRADATEALPLYAIDGPPLRPGFPWCTLHEGSNGDDLFTSRAHRFPFAPRHGLAILYGEASPAALADILEDWMQAVATKGCLYAYESLSIVLERVVALGWAHAFAAAAPDAATAESIRLQSDILMILHADLQFMAPRLGSSYPNGHLLGDVFAGWYLALLLPELMPESTDLDVKESTWLAELDRQIYPDGTGFEHAVKYHQGICQMAAAYIILSRRNARPIPMVTWRRIERMLAFQVGLAGPHCHKLFIGDGIDTSLFTLDTGTGWPTAALRELYRALFRPELDPAPPSDPSVERAFWLLGGALAPADTTSLEVEETVAHYWPDGGICVFPDRTNPARLVFRTGPAEHRDVIAGHMHADLLSICFSHGSQPVLIDPGTYSYRFGNEHVRPGRAYFIGPAAHNGLYLDGVDPLGTVTGDFRQGGSPVHVVTRMQQFGQSLSWLDAELRGDSIYSGHRRGVVHIEGVYWVVYDCLPPAARYVEATMGFQAAPGVCATLDVDAARFETSAGTLWLAGSPGLGSPEITSGEHDPESGWVSPRYGELVAAPQLRYTINRGTKMAAFIMGTGTAPIRPVSVQALRAGIAIRMEGSTIRDVLLLATHDEGIRLDRASSSGGVARALWLRYEHGTPLMLKCLGYQDAGHTHPHDPAAFRGCRDDRLASREYERGDLEGLSVVFCGAQWC